MDDTVIYFPPFRLDPANERLWRGSRPVALKPKTFAVLRYLLERPRRLVTKDDLLDALWSDAHVGEAVLKTHLREIRRALGDRVKAPRFIETVHRRGYRFVGPVRRSAAPARKPQSGHGFVGRQADLERLQGALQRAREGQRQVVFVTGEPGIGKTALLKEFLEQLHGRDDLWLAWGQCIEHYGVGEGYLPVLEALGRLCRAPGAQRIVEIVRRRAPTWLVEIPDVLDPAAQAALRGETSGATPQRMLREIAEALEALSERRPLVLWFEDLHWADHSTLDLIAYLARRSGHARLLLLGTYRSAEVAGGQHPLGAIEQELVRQRQCHELALTCLAEDAVGEYLQARCPEHRFPTGLAALIHQRTDGNPLFMVNVVDSLVERGTARRVDGRWQLTAELHEVAVAVPESVIRMIQAEIDRLSPLERSTLEAASVAGMDFSAAAVAAAVDADVVHVEEVCARLARRRQFLLVTGRAEWPDGTVATRCSFVHALHHEVVYERVGAARRAQLHRQIGERHEAGYGDRAAELAAELAVHFERGRDNRRAVHYSRLAGDNALRLSAYREAAVHLTRALTLLEARAETPATLAEIVETRLALAPALIALTGAGSPEVEDSYLRAWDAVNRLGDESGRFPVLWGLWFVNYSRGRYAAAHEAGEHLLEAARGSGDREQLMEAHHSLWPTLLAMGQISAAVTHLERGFSLYDRDRHAWLSLRYGGHDPGVCCHYYQAVTSWLLGYPDRAVGAVQAGMRLVDERRHPLTTVNWLWFHALIHYQRGEHDAASAIANRVVTLSAEQGLAGWADAALSLTGRATNARLDARSLGELQSRLVSAWSGGAIWRQVFCLCALAEIHVEHGRVDDALAAITSIPESVRGAFYAPELHRIAGEALLRRAPPRVEDAERHFQAALELARAREEKSLELRAATSLARCWQAQGRQDEARRLLAAARGWFTEGFETADLRAAGSLLEQIS
jgi:DNA-binding winged helix-turn-helix (wHTH) protein/tetratricopeptide (TPR) repeat protein